MPELKKYLVISYDDDQQCSYWDHVAAVDEDAAKQIVDKARPYAIAVDAMDQAEVDSLGKLLRNNKKPHTNAYDLGLMLDTGEDDLLEAAIEALPGRRYRLLVADSNDVERGTVDIPVGHPCTIGEFDHNTELFTVKFDDNADGEDMGHCLYTLEEIHTNLEAIR